MKAALSRGGNCLARHSAFVGVIARLDRAIQYSPAVVGQMSHIETPWLLDHPVKPGDDGKA
jgi:hypothetical protein